MDNSPSKLGVITKILEIVTLSLHLAVSDNYAVRTSHRPMCPTWESRFEAPLGPAMRSSFRVGGDP